MTDKDILLEHDYDGIQEYDNDLPLWWRNIFIITTVYAIGYAIYVHGGFAETAEQKLERELAQLQAYKEARLASASEPEKENADEFFKDKSFVDAGAVHWKTHCVACHGANGEGLVGPNLTDNYWIHGGSVENIQNVITNGVPAKGMIAWNAMLSPQQIKEVTAYVWSLKGTNVEGKAPEGDLETDDQSATKATQVSLAQEFDNDDMVARGKEIFKLNCSSCHSANGEGLIGPNLTDKFWIHGGTPEDIVKVITEGVPAKGMIAWSAMLTGEQIKDVSAYVWSIRNNNIAGKAPEGEPVEN